MNLIPAAENNAAAMIIDRTDHRMYRLIDF